MYFKLRVKLKRIHFTDKGENKKKQTWCERSELTPYKGVGEQQARTGLAH